METDGGTTKTGLFPRPAVPDWNNSRNYPYGYNYQFLGNARPKGMPTGGGALFWVYYPVMSSSIKAAQTVMAVDCNGTAAGQPESPRTKQFTLRPNCLTSPSKQDGLLC